MEHTATRREICRRLNQEKEIEQVRKAGCHDELVETLKLSLEHLKYNAHNKNLQDMIIRTLAKAEGK